MAGMDEIESAAQSFIIRIWVEEYTEESDQGVWRGHITHVSSGRRRYLKDLDEIGDFIAPYLEAMGIRPGIYWRVRCWLKRLLGRG